MHCFALPFDLQNYSGHVEGQNGRPTDDIAVTQSPGIPTAPANPIEAFPTSPSDEVSGPPWTFSSEPPSPTPDMPQQLTVVPPVEVGKELLVSWMVPPPSNNSAPLSHFNVEYKQDISHAWTKSADSVPADNTQTIMQYHSEWQTLILAYHRNNIQTNAPVKFEAVHSQTGCVSC